MKEYLIENGYTGGERMIRMMHSMGWIQITDKSAKTICGWTLLLQMVIFCMNGQLPKAVLSICVAHTNLYGSD